MGARRHVVGLSPGQVVWVTLDPTVGREQSGRRPALVIAGSEYLRTVDTLVVIVPITSVDRGWPNHIQVTGSDLGRDCWAMTEQIRTVARERIVGLGGRVEPQVLRAVRMWVKDFLDLG